MRIILYKLLYLSLSIILISCKNFTSLYNKDVINGQKICIFLNIENNFSKHFLNKLKENPHIVDFPHCEYLLFAIIYDKTLSITNMIGLQQGKIIDMNVYCTLYKNDHNKIKDIEEIFTHPNNREYKQYIERNNFYLSSKPNMVNESNTVNYNNEGLRTYYYKMQNRLNKVLTKINEIDIQEQLSYSQNPLLPFSSTQSKQDYELQIANIIAERTIQNVIIDIIEYKQIQENIKNKCIKLYEQEINTKKLKSKNNKVKTVNNECQEIWNKYKQQYNIIKKTKNDKK